MGENKPSKLDLKTDFFKDKVKVKAKGENSGPDLVVRVDGQLHVVLKTLDLGAHQKH